jgi:hypothetical protein
MAIRFSMGKVLAILLALFVQFAFAQTVWDGTADTTWYTSNKSATEFTITTAEQLAGLVELRNNPSPAWDGGNYLLAKKTIKLGNNIMINDTANWENWAANPPINEWTPIDFWGIFDGNGYVISGVYINSENNYQGLFGFVEGEIKNFRVTASYIKGNNDIGGLVGRTRTDGIINGYFIGTVIGKNYVGGLVGYNNRNGTIIDSYFIGTVTGKDYVGGLAGENYGGTIGKSYSIGAVTEGEDYVGGLVGINVGTVTNSYSIGTVRGKNYVGGLVGNNKDTVTNSYFVGNVIGLGGSSLDIGGLVGYRYDGSSVVYSYYDYQIKGEIRETYNGKSTEQMKEKSTFIDWDFNKIWGIDSQINYGYPHLLGFEYSEGEECEAAGNKWTDSTCKITSTIRSLQIANSQIIARTTNNGIILENLPRNAKVEAYNLHGKRIYSGNPENPKILKIMVQTRGIYVVKAGTQTFRVAVGQK